MLGHLDAAGCDVRARPRRGRRARRQHLRVHRGRARGIDPGDPRGRGAEDARDACSALVVAGCMVQRYGDELRARAARGRRVRRPGRAVDDRRRGAHRAASPAERSAARADARRPTPAVRAAAASRPISTTTTTPRSLATPPWTAYVKIAEGCDHTCSFCAIPSFRGTFRSRRSGRASCARRRRSAAARRARDQPRSPRTRATTAATSAGRRPGRPAATRSTRVVRAALDPRALPLPEHGDRPRCSRRWRGCRAS